MMMIRVTYELSLTAVSKILEEGFLIVQRR